MSKLEPKFGWNRKCDVDLADVAIFGDTSAFRVARNSKEATDAVRWHARDAYDLGLSCSMTAEKINELNATRKRNGLLTHLTGLDVETECQLEYDRLAYLRESPGLKSKMHTITDHAARDAMPVIEADDWMNVPEVTKNHVKNPYQTAKDFRDQLRSTLIYQNDDWLAYTGSHYAEVEAEAIKAELYAFISRSFKPNTGAVKDVEHALKAICHKAVNAFTPPCWLDGAGPFSADEVLAFTDGLLHLPTLAFIKPTSNFFNRNALSYGFDAKAPRPKDWLAFCEDVFEGSPGSVELMQEIFGYMLLPDNSFQKAFIWDSPPRGGKGTSLRILGKLVGEHNCTSPTMSGLGKDVILDSMVGKQVAIISDMRITTHTNVGSVAENILRITGGDAVTFDRKYKSAWTGFLTVRFFLLTNLQMAVADVSGALANRFVCLKSFKSWLGKEEPALESRLVPELPGILLWAIEGWKRLKKRGRFVQTEEGEAMLRRMMDAASPVNAFVREHCIYDPKSVTPKQTLYAAWDEFGERSLSYPVFCRDLLAATGGKVRESKLWSGGDRTPSYIGIRLATDDDW